jgi:hypothetical protein
MENYDLKAFEKCVQYNNSMMSPQDKCILFWNVYGS